MLYDFGLIHSSSGVMNELKVTKGTLNSKQQLQAKGVTLVT
nr:MAG TPA: hypothetical protein [Caudoviricetes sp.]